MEKIENNSKTSKSDYIEHDFHGTSMLPILHEFSDKVLIQALSNNQEVTTTIQAGDVILFKKYNNYVLHRVMSISKGQYLAQGDNLFSTDVVDPSDVIGTMVGFIHNGKTIYVNDKKYKRYVKYVLHEPHIFKKVRCKLVSFVNKILIYKQISKTPCREQNQYLYSDESARIVLGHVTNDHQAKDDPYVITIENGIILPRKRFGNGRTKFDGGGVLTSDFEYVKESAEYDFRGSYDFDKNDIEKRDECVIYLGRAYPHYGVVMIDTLRRLYYKYLPTNIYNSDENLDVKFAILGCFAPENNFGKSDDRCWEFLNSCGVKKEDVIDVRKPTQFKKVIIPEPGFEYDRYYHNEFYLPYKYAVEHACLEIEEPKNNLNIYLSRRRMGNLKETGEAIFEKFFKMNGYKVIYPDDLSIKEQIEILQNAKCIASVEGTISHNILFCKPGTKQIVIRKDKRIEPRHFLFNELMNSEPTYIDAYCNYIAGFPRHYDIGPFCIIFNKNIRDFARDNNYKLPFGWRINNVQVLIKYFYLCLKQKSPGSH